MFVQRRVFVLFLVCVTLLALNTVYHRRHAWIIPSQDGGGIAKPPAESSGPEPIDSPHLSEWKDVFPAGELKPAGSEYSRSIVMARLTKDNVSWVEDQLQDLLQPNGPFNKHIYVANDRSAELHTKKNKGHEVMIYLTYIIENYETLPDVTIFIHADRWAWHNNALLDDDMAAMIRYLSPEQVTRRGYVNLRCHWKPGCPNWLYLRTQQNSKGQQGREEKALAKYWNELFPIDKMPDIVSQPCCAQFAVSRERLLALPKQRYIYFRSWISRTPVNDYDSGRMFEYVWQYIFTGNAEVCPDMRTCYCENYGICFEDKTSFEAWFKLRYQKTEYQKQIKQQQQELEGTKTLTSQMALETAPPEMQELQRKIKGLSKEMQEMRDEAFMRGNSGKSRPMASARPGD